MEELKALVKQWMILPGMSKVKIVQMAREKFTRWDEIVADRSDLNWKYNVVGDILPPNAFPRGGDHKSAAYRSRKKQAEMEAIQSAAQQVPADHRDQAEWAEEFVVQAVTERWTTPNERTRVGFKHCIRRIYRRMRTGTEAPEVDELAGFDDDTLCELVPTTGGPEAAPPVARDPPMTSSNIADPVENGSLIAVPERLLEVTQRLQHTDKELALQLLEADKQRRQDELRRIQLQHEEAEKNRQHEEAERKRQHEEAERKRQHELALMELKHRHEQELRQAPTPSKKRPRITESPADAAAPSKRPRDRSDDGPAWELWLHKNNRNLPSVAGLVWSKYQQTHQRTTAQQTADDPDEQLTPPPRPNHDVATVCDLVHRWCTHPADAQPPLSCLLQGSRVRVSEVRPNAIHPHVLVYIRGLSVSDLERLIDDLVQRLLGPIPPPPPAVSSHLSHAE